jgi:hypothetical protein
MTMDPTLLILIFPTFLISAENNDIPRTTAFRKIKWLLNQEILIVENIEVIVEAEQNINIAKRWVAKFFP